MNGWAAFWIMIAVITATEIVIDYFIWKTKIEYGIKDKKSRLIRFLTKERK